MTGKNPQQEHSGKPLPGEPEPGLSAETVAKESRPVSLRARLTLFAVVMLMVSLGLVGLALDAAYRRSAEMSLQQQMETWAYVVLASMEVDAGGNIELIVQPADPMLLQPGSGVYAVITSPSNQWQSPSSLGADLPVIEPIDPGDIVFTPVGPGNPFYRQQYGLAWELPNRNTQDVTVSVLVDEARQAPALDAFRQGLWRSLLAAGLLLALAQAIWSVFSLRPLRKVASDVGRLEAGESGSLPGPYPVELEPLRRNIDHLLAAEQANQKRYRNALDSLAHSLKTPLAVLRAGLDDVESRDKGMHKAVDDMHYLITSRLERAAAGTRRALSAPVSVAEIVQRVADTLQKVHSHELRTLDVTVEPGLKFFGEERDLMELSGNLLENACKYGAGTVRLSASAIRPDQAAPRARNGLCLSVESDGDYVALDDLVQRGKRGDERVEGHGLGLTIVNELVSAYGGDWTFEHSDLGGVKVTLKLP